MNVLKAGVAAAILGAMSIFLGVFGFAYRCAVPGVPCPSPSPNEILAYGGLVVLVVGVLLLAAAATVPATWFLYEIVRQEGCPLLPDPDAAEACLGGFGEMTAPVISFGVAALILLVGWLRWRSTSSPVDIARP